MSERNKNILLGVLIVGILSMTVAFAALTSRLNIGGTTNVAATRWNIHFQNWALDTASTITVGSNTQHNTAEYPAVNQLTMSDNTNVTKVEGINVTLNQPNDYVKYTFEIKNDGTIDGELSGFERNLTCTGNNCESVIDYTVACEDASHNDALSANYVLQADTAVSCYLQIKYKDVDNVSKADITNKIAANVAGTNQVYTQGTITATIAPAWSWIQSTQTANNNSGSGSGSQSSNPYETTNTGNYVAYYWNDVATSGYSEGNTYHSGENAWFTSLNPNSKAYLRTTGSLPEVCGVFSSGTVCMTSSYYNSDYSSAGNYNSDFSTCSSNVLITSSNIDDSCLTGYAKAKVVEMLSKGASSCYNESEYVGKNVRCSGGVNSAMACSIYYDGYVFCGGESGYDVFVGSDGSSRSSD